MSAIEVTYVVHNNDYPSHIIKETKTFSNKEDFEYMNSALLYMSYNTLDYVYITFSRHYLSIRIDSDKFPSFAQAVDRFSGDMDSLVVALSNFIDITGYDWFMRYVTENSEFPVIENIEILETVENIDVEAYAYYDGWHSAVGEHFINTRYVDKISEALGQHVQESIVEFLDCGIIGEKIVDKYGYNYNGHGTIFRYVQRLD